MASTRMTAQMRTSLQSRLADLDARIETLDAQRKGDDSVESTALMIQLTRERSDVAEALLDAVLIDDDPFDTHAIEIGDTVTIRDDDGRVDRYVLIDGNVRSRASSDWVSVSSPLGAAILARSKGDRVQVDSPAGPASYFIVDFARSSQDSVEHAISGKRVSASARRLLPSEAFIG